MDTFTQQYMATALWASNDESDERGGNPIDDNYGIEDISEETKAAMAADCAKFQAENLDMIASDLSQAGHDFWLTRHGHGAGFWDGDWPEHGDALTKACEAYPEFDLYIGDDGKIYA